jgi:protoheme IX farnesyltransferase
MPAHLVTTFLLLMSLALTAWWSSGGRAPRLRENGSLAWALGGGLAAAMLVGVSGALTALGDTIFPARSLSEGLRQSFDPSAHFLIGVRKYHPLIAICAGLYLTVTAGRTMSSRPGPDVQRFGRALLILFLVQMGAGLVNLALLAPVALQLLHLLVADLIWVSLVLMAASALSEPAPALEDSSLAREVGSSAPHWNRRAKADVGVLGGASASAAGVGVLGGVPASTASTATWRDYLALTKPRVISLLLFTTVAAMPVAARGESGPGPSLALYLAVAIGFYMAAGAANAINMVLERDLDLLMGRTARRPTVTQSIPPAAALRFALALMVGSFVLLWWAANLLSAMLAMAGLSFYVIVYTLLLKRRTWANIVIGGAAGAFPPLVGWAAVTGDLSPLAWCLFGIIFLWTPVHFWALALLIKEDYARAGVPMLPVVRGERATVAQIGYYTLLTVAVSIVPLMLQGENGRSAVGWLYLGTAVALNAGLILRSLQLYHRPDHPRARSLFKYSMIYLALLFLAMAVDRTSLASPRAVSTDRPENQALVPHPESREPISSIEFDRSMDAAGGKGLL